MTDRFTGRSGSFTSQLHTASQKCSRLRLTLGARMRTLFAIAVLPLFAACTESIDGGGACPLLCPGRENEFRDTVFDAVVLDTTIGNFPTSGLNALIPIASRGDTLQTSMVVRYDRIATAYRPNTTGDTVPITAIDSVWIRLSLDPSGRIGTEPVTIEAFDVDTTVADSVTSVVQSLFRADRQLGSVTVTPSQVGDSLRVPLDGAKVLHKVRNGARMRVGLRISGAGQLRVDAFTFGASSVILSFDAVGDTVYSPIRTVPFTTIPNTTTEHELAYTVYGIVDHASPLAGFGLLQIGGMPAKRAYFEFSLPRALLDSATIVRAELLLTQVPTPHARATDTAFVEALVPAAGPVVTDLRRSLDLATRGYFFGLDSTRVLPAQAGQTSINILGVVRAWRFLPDGVPRAIGLSFFGEGYDALDIRFLSSEGATSPSSRPRLRITYLPRAEFSRP